tara:strand:+ start:432 stop:926 length:495 start_codon:yes stop_codon:yes gene_type:complete
MLYVKITEQMLEKATRKAVSMGKIRNSITHGQGNISGFLGEEIVNHFLNGKQQNTYDYDIVKGDVKIDVKTKRCTSKPKSYYDCSIAKTSLHQKCDKYVFVRIEWHKERPDEWKNAWILGELSKKDYFKKSRELTKGQVDPSNNFTVKADCYNVAIKDLDEFVY